MENKKEVKVEVYSKEIDAKSIEELKQKIQEVEEEGIVKGGCTIKCIIVKTGLDPIS